MSSKDILVPNIGDFKDVEVIEVLVKAGQKIKKNESLITIESDKSSVEVPSTSDGIIEKIYEFLRCFYICEIAIFKNSEKP